MKVEVGPVDDLESYGQISIAFEVRSRLDIVALRRGEFAEIPVEPFVKEYDALSPVTEWPSTFDLRNWRTFRCEQGAATVAWNTPGVDMLERRRDLAVLWDIRIAPEARGRGFGRVLVEAVIGWAKDHGCVELKVETQDINVAACRFYSAMGFRLAEVVPDAYPGFDETQLIWRKAI